MRIAIAGYGVEGRSSYDYYAKLGHEIVIADEREVVEDLPASVEVILGEEAFSKLNGFDLVIRTPSLDPKKINTDGKIWSATNEFFAQCPAPIIGVTGTKGKGTTCSFIASILSSAGKNVHLLGNIGRPALDSLSTIKADDIVVYELSSFQLWDFEGSPSVAVMLMIEPDHLNIHAGMKDYIGAKANLIRNLQPGAKVYYYSRNELTQKAVAGIQTDDNVEVSPYATRQPGCVYISDGDFMKDNVVIAPVSAVKLPGVHNLENACAAISAALNFTSDYEAIARGLSEFTGLDHRLKFVDEISGVEFYDDSIATTPGSAIAAIRSFEEPKVIILGGSDKGSDYRELIEVCARTETRVLAIGESRDKIKKLCDEYEVYCVVEGGSMTEIVRQAGSLASEGGVVILSPAAASFDMFRSYSDRGDQFVAAVKELGDK